MSSLAVGTPDSRFSVSPQRVTLVDLLEWRARSQAERVAYAFLDEVETERISLSWAELQREQSSCSPARVRAKITRLKQRRRTERRLKALTTSKTTHSSANGNAISDAPLPNFGQQELEKIAMLLEETHDIDGLNEMVE